MPKITDIWKCGVDPTNQEIVIYPRGERPPYPKRNECGNCWERERILVKGKLEKHEYVRSTHRIYECPKCGNRWEGQRTRKRI